MTAAGHGGQGRIAAAFIQYEPALVRYAQRLTGDAETAREIVQDTFLRFCQSTTASGAADRPPAATPAPGGSPETNGHAAWLFAVCRNRAIDVLKRRRTIRLESGPAGAEVADPSPPQGAALERAEDHAEVLAWLASLPSRQRDVVRLKFHAGLTYAEIGELLGLSETNVGFLIHTAIKSLRASASQQ